MGMVLYIIFFITEKYSLYLFLSLRFQYVLAAATSIATKVNEETLTYLNQGQSYEIKLKKLGELSAYRGKILKVRLMMRKGKSCKSKITCCMDSILVRVTYMTFPLFTNLQKKVFFKISMVKGW